MDKKTASEIIAKTKDDYNRMAVEFARTRGGLARRSPTKPWRSGGESSLPQDLLDLKRYIVKGDKNLDLGCGNGRFSELFEDEDYVGVDVSEELVKIAQIKYPLKKFAVLDAPDIVERSTFSVQRENTKSDTQRAAGLPFQDGTFDKVFCLAVVHHIPSAEFRRAFLAEAKRVLKPGGLLILTAWYLLDKPKTWRELAKMALLKIAGRNKMDLGDILVPFKDSKGTVLAERYVHTFSVAELRKLVEKQGFKIESAGLVSRGKNRNVEVVGK